MADLNTEINQSKTAAEIRITPQGQLRLALPGETPESARLSALHDAFESDWRGGLFTLAAEKPDADGSLSLRYWRELAEQYVTGLCHVPGNEDAFEIEPLEQGDCARLILTAPPMRGGEYLSIDMLLNVWACLDAWVHESVSAAGGVESFLSERAPRWRQVGRVCFHLAENKSDEARPFAFMATYIAGFGVQERLRHQPLRKALEQYAGARNKAALVKLLSPVHRASERCEWVGALAASGEIYQPMAWTADRAYEFLRSVPDLEDSGLAVRLPNWWKKRPRPRVAVTIGEKKQSVLGVDSMLDFDVRVALGDEALSREELEALLAGEDGLVLLKGQWVEVDRERLSEAIDHWDRLRDHAKDGEISFIEGMRLLAGAPADLKDDSQSQEEREWAHVSAGQGMLEILKGLRDPGNMDSANDVQGLGATLRPYQRHGLAWLNLLAGLGLGACLADDMGLGKTIQVLALLLHMRGQDKKRDRRPSLLVAPVSLLGNWRDEAARFTPSLNLEFLHPSETDRERLAQIEKNPGRHLAGADLVVTTYSMVARQKWLADMRWRLVILDEAQAIKNHGTRQSKAVKLLPAHSRIAMTGTPVENRLGDLWSLFDFLNPGLLGSARVFKSFVNSLNADGQIRFGPLRRLVAPYILRRLKTDRSVIADLPDKTETIRYCTLTPKQARMYEQVVRIMESELKLKDGIARRGLILQVLMRLKQICNHPCQCSGDTGYKPEDSGKFARISEICEELAARQEKALVFTQFREIIDPLAEHLAGVFGRTGLILHGGTSANKRKSIVDQFQNEDGPPFFILSLKAGGTGLNLTAAAHVIHFDRWWNPAVENQATDRAFRIGQNKNVLVHKFVTTGTVEERIDAMIEEKKQLAQGVLAGGGEINLTEMNDAELLRLVRLDVNRAVN
jgi:non-specific serine/threonine protein kinase